MNRIAVVAGFLALWLAASASAWAEETQTSGGVLYETDAAKDGFEGWSLAPGWKRLSGMLLSDGTETKVNTPILAPYEPESPDYVIEAKIRVIESLSGSFGIVMRADGKEGYAAGLGTGIWDRRLQAPNICYLDARFHRRGCKAEAERFEPGTDLRTYRVEVRGNTIALLIDGVGIANAADNKFLSPGRVGLWSDGYQLEVRSFRVFGP